MALLRKRSFPSLAAPSSQTKETQRTEGTAAGLGDMGEIGLQDRHGRLVGLVILSQVLGIEQK